MTLFNAHGKAQSRGVRQSSVAMSGVIQKRLLLPLIAFTAGGGNGSTNRPWAHVAGDRAGRRDFRDRQDGRASGDEYKVEMRCFKKTGRRVRSMSSLDGSGMIDERVAVIPNRYRSPTILMQAITNGDRYE